MNCTQNEKISQVTEKTLVIGIDIASETPYARAFDWRGIELWSESNSLIKKSYVKTALAFTNEAEGFEKFNDWVSKIMKNHSKTKTFNHY